MGQHVIPHHSTSINRALRRYENHQMVLGSYARLLTAYLTSHESSIARNPCARPRPSIFIRTTMAAKQIPLVLHQHEHS